MENKRELGLNAQQLEQLKEVEEIANVKYLQRKCKQIQSDFEHLQKQRDEHLHAREQLRRRLDIVEDDVEKASIEETAAQHKLNSIKMYQKCEDIRLENICLLLGFQLSKWHLLRRYQTDKKVCETFYANNASQFLYENELNVTYDDLKNLIDHIQSNPPNSEIEKIQEFVKNSQDMAGLLKSLKQLIDTETMPELSNHN